MSTDNKQSVLTDMKLTAQYLWDDAIACDYGGFEAKVIEALSKQRGADPLGLTAVAEKMYKALCEELAAYDPPISHVQAAVQAYRDWSNFSDTAPQSSAEASLLSGEVIDAAVAQQGKETCP